MRLKDFLLASIMSKMNGVTENRIYFINFVGREHDVLPVYAGYFYFCARNGNV